MRRTFYAVNRKDVGYHLGSLIDMLRYDSSEVVQHDDKQIILVSWYNSVPTIAWWRSFGIKVEQLAKSEYAFSTPEKRNGKKEIYFLVKRELLNDFVDFIDKDHDKKLGVVLDLLQNDRAIPVSNPPSGFYCFRSANFNLNFKGWRDAGIPIHYATRSRDDYQPSSLYTAATREPMDRDFVFDDKLMR